MVSEQGLFCDSAPFFFFFSRAFLHLPDAKFWFQSAYGRSTSSSPKGMSGPSLASSGWAGNSRSDCACARMAASAARAVHLRASARLATPSEPGTALTKTSQIARPSGLISVCGILSQRPGSARGANDDPEVAHSTPLSSDLACWLYRCTCTIDNAKNLHLERRCTPLLSVITSPILYLLEKYGNRSFRGHHDLSA